MKSLKISFFALLVSIPFIFTNCTKEALPISETENVLIRNAWYVDYYYNAQDLTYEFVDIRVMFSSTGSAAVEKAGETIYGTWERKIDTNEAELVTINFDTTDPVIMKLNEVWKLDARSSNVAWFIKNGTTDLQLRIKTQ